MMQAIVYSRADPEGIRLTSKPRPSTNSSSHLLCKIAYAGVNPVDVKFLVGDKLPKWCLGLGRWAVEGRTAGFDFSGTVVCAAPGDKRFKTGDAVYGTAPPGVGTFCEVQGDRKQSNNTPAAWKPSEFFPASAAIPARTPPPRHPVHPHTLAPSARRHAAPPRSSASPHPRSPRPPSRRAVRRSTWSCPRTRSPTRLAPSRCGRRRRCPWWG
jgi:hypothetical protein